MARRRTGLCQDRQGCVSPTLCRKRRSVIRGRIAEARRCVKEIAETPARQKAAQEAARAFEEFTRRHAVELEAARKKFFATRSVGCFETIQRLRSLAKRRPSFFLVDANSIQLRTPK